MSGGGSACFCSLAWHLGALEPLQVGLGVRVVVGCLTPEGRLREGERRRL